MVFEVIRVVNKVSLFRKIFYSVFCMHHTCLSCFFVGEKGGGRGEEAITGKYREIVQEDRFTGKINLFLLFFFLYVNVRASLTPPHSRSYGCHRNLKPAVRSSRCPGPTH